MLHVPLHRRRHGGITHVVGHAAMTGMRIRRLVLSAIGLDHSGGAMHRVPLMRISRRRSVTVMMLRLGHRWSRMVLVIVMWGFRVIHRVPFDRAVPHRTNRSRFLRRNSAGHPAKLQSPFTIYPRRV